MEASASVEPSPIMPSDNEAASPAKDEPQREPYPADSLSEEGEARSEDSSREDGQEKEGHSDDTPSKEPDSTDAPPLPDEPVPGAAPPLPKETPPEQADDGWEAQWDATNSAWYFYNRFTGVSQWDNPRVPTTGDASSSSAPAPAAPGTSSSSAAMSQPVSVAGGYNPAIHGSWDPNAAYAQAYKAGDEEYDADLAAYNAEMMAGVEEGEEGGEPYLQGAAFNKGSGKFQTADQNPDRHSDANKSYRQMNAYFNVDQAANSHDGRSLKAERRGKQPTRKELAMWKEKRKARKEEKRRAWLRD